MSTILQMGNTHLTLLVIGIGALLSILSWMFVMQIQTNKSFRDAVTEFRVAIAVMNEQNKNRDLVCIQHRAQLSEGSAAIREEIHELNGRLNEHLLDPGVIQSKIKIKRNG